MFLNKVLEERNSKINGLIKVVRTLGLGTYIQVDNLTQSGGIISDIWRPILKKISNFQFPISNCLILGLGGGTVATLVHETWPEAKITGVDIDPVMVELGKKYLGLDKIPIDIRIEDAYKFKYKVRYDLIIVDLYLGKDFPKKFEDDEFIERVKQHSDLVIFNRLYFGEQRPAAVKFGNKLKRFFGRVDFVYPQANLLLVCSSSAKIK